jgi:hypothetical protein
LVRISIILFTVVMLASLGCARIGEEGRQLSECGRPGCFQEEWVISKLKQKLKPFVEFYKAERGKMPQHIHWTEDTKLPVDASAFTITTNNTITLKKIPPGTEDDFVVAHELCSFLIWADGFPRTFPTIKAETDGVADISSYLNTMLDTPLRDIILKKYGFDVEGAYQFYLGDSLKGASRAEGLTVNTRRLLFYVQMVLYWEDVLNKSETSEFQRKWDSWYPMVAQDGASMLRKVRQIGYNSPEKMQLLYEDIIQSWSLYEIVGLMTRQ